MKNKHLHQKKLKIITHNEEVGLGANVFRMFAHLLLLKKNEIVYFDVKNIYYCNKGNVWDIFFFQPFHKYIKIIEYKIKNNIFDKINWREEKQWNINYITDGEKKNIYNKKLINNYRNLFKKFIKFKPQIKKHYIKTLKKIYNKKILSINIRATDRFVDLRNMNLQNELEYESLINTYLKKKKCNKILLCTDSKRILDLYKKKFGSKIINNSTILSDDNRSIHKSNIFQSDKFKFKLGSEAISDAVLMSKCKYNLFMHSNISYLAVMLRNDFNYKFIDDSFSYK